MLNIQDNIFKNFSGAWRLERKITNYSDSNSSIIAYGKVIFISLSKNRILMHENARVKIIDSDLIARKTYILEAYSTSGIKQYYFERPLSINCATDIDRADLSSGIEMFELKFKSVGKDYQYKARGRYFCKPDYYYLTYLIEQDNKILTNCVVKGPNKNILIETEYYKEVK